MRGAQDDAIERDEEPGSEPAIESALRDRCKMPRPQEHCAERKRERQFQWIEEGYVWKRRCVARRERVRSKEPYGEQRRDGCAGAHCIRIAVTLERPVRYGAPLRHEP